MITVLEARGDFRAAHTESMSMLDNFLLSTTHARALRTTVTAGSGATLLGDAATIETESNVFAGIAVATSYLRPNGESYVPRKMAFESGTIHDVTFVRSAANNGMPVLLYGPPGTGKTALIEASLDNVQTVQGTIETEASDFVGSWVQNQDGTYGWVDGPLVVAATNGWPLFIDEIALIDPRSLAVVYGAMDGRDEIVVTQNPKRGIVKVQPGFIVMGAFNPDVPGAIMSDALMSRFPVQINIMTDFGLAKSLGIPADIIQVVRNLNHKAASGEMTSAPQLREMLAYKKLYNLYGKNFALRNFIGQIRPENRAVAADIIKSVMGTEPVALIL